MILQKICTDKLKVVDHGPLPDIINLDSVSTGGHTNTGSTRMELTILSKSLANIERCQSLARCVGSPDLDSFVITAADNEPAIRRPSAAPDPVLVLSEAVDKLGPLD